LPTTAATIDLRTSAAAALLAGGLAWIVDVAIITAGDGSFGLPDSILFVSGLAALVAGTLLTAAAVTRGRTGARRAGAFAGGLVAIVVGLTLISMAADAISHAAYHGSNHGLHNECGVFATGVCGVVLGLLVHRIGSRVPQDG
jgi:hypothetical protein